jgi:hypothetical protein
MAPISQFARYRIAGISIPADARARYTASIDACTVLDCAFMLFKRNGPDAKLMKEFIVEIVS